MNNINLKAAPGLVLGVLLLTASLAHGQNTTKVWTLDQCLQHALENNLSLKSAALDVTQSEVVQRQATRDYLPVVNAGASHGYNWGQRIDPFTNEFASERVRTNNLYVGGNWLLFNGLQNYYLVQKARTEVAYQQYNQEVQERNLKIDVTAHYLQVLLADQQLKNAREQLAYTRKLQQRTRELLQAEQATELSMLEVEAQTALDSLSVTQANNSLRLAEFRLKQFLNLPPEASFQLDKAKGNLPINPESPPIVMEQLPELLRAEELAKINETNLKIARRQLSPSLSLNASMGSGYSGNNTEQVGTEFVAKSFNRQLDENFYQAAAVTLSVPIFNKGTVGSSITRSRIELEKATLQKQNLRLELQNKIAQLQLELENAQLQQTTAQTARNATQKALEIAQLNYEEGRINFADFLEVRNKHFLAQSQSTNAQFEYLFKKKILNYYSG